jgi:hypothetical protein
MRWAPAQAKKKICFTFSEITKRPQETGQEGGCRRLPFAGRRGPRQLQREEEGNLGIRKKNHRLSSELNKNRSN